MTMRLPSRLRFALAVFLALAFISAGLRLVFWLFFRDPGGDTADILSAFALGLRYDVRLAVLLLVPHLLLGNIPHLNPERSPRARRLWVRHFAVVGGLVLFGSLVDLGHYAYLRQHVDASVLRFLSDPWISLRFVWESYPVAWAAAGLLVAGLVFERGLRRLAARCFAGEFEPRSRRARAFAIGLTVVVCAAGIYGKASFYPLRWSDAYFGGHRFASDVALNPILYFFDTVGTAEDMDYDLAEVDRGFDDVASYVGAPAGGRETRSLARPVRLLTPARPRPSVVLVLMESFAAHMTGAFGNPLDASPNFDRLARDSLLFRRFYTPRQGTARAVYAILTGIPDTATRQTASRNPRTMRHYMIADALEGYEKFYFLGGSANWANIRGLLAGNIRGLRIHEEGSYSAPRVDVWGISDLSLLEEAHAVLRRVENRPFFALIHLSGNHRPYTIPDDRRGFELASVDAKTLRKHGFESLAEYNSFRFLDFSIGHYMRLVRDEPYARETIFAFVGDNGIVAPAVHMPSAEQRLHLGAHHVPFVVHAPSRLAPRVDARTASQLDIMPTLASLAGVPVANTTLGRNLLDPTDDGPHYAFVQMGRGAFTETALIGDDVCLVAPPGGRAPRLHSLDPATPAADVTDALPTRAAAMARLLRGYASVSRYLMYRNTRERYGALLANERGTR